MAKEIQLFKGGWCGDVTDRIVPNQRPADGHQKPAVWEDFLRTDGKPKCGTVCGSACLDIEVGDVIGIHTTLTMGAVFAFGLGVNAAEEGLQFKVVSREGNVDLSKIHVRVYEYDDANEQFTVVGTDTTLDAITDIGSNVRFYSGFVEKLTDVRVDNTDMIGLEVVAVPAGGVQGEFDIETRLHNSQPVRPPAVLHCC